MRIRLEQNPSLEGQPQPLLAGEVLDRVARRPARKVLLGEALELGHLIPDPRLLEADLEEKTIEPQGFLSAEEALEAFPPRLRAQEVDLLDSAEGQSVSLETEAHEPDHLAVSPTPSAGSGFPGPSPVSTRASAHPPNTENRRILQDTSYPWSCCGRVDSPVGFASGVMVGPRHLLTVRNAIGWAPNGRAGWLRFRPSFFNGRAPFGEAWGQVVLHKNKSRDSALPRLEDRYDYVCVVLDWRIGNLTGWMGSRSYAECWDGGAFWSHVGYPGDLTGGNRPIFQGAIALDGAVAPSRDPRGSLSTEVRPGQGGGPFFGWWAGEKGPRAVAVQSGRGAAAHRATGGQDMVHLILEGRRRWP